MVTPTSRSLTHPSAAHAPTVAHDGKDHVIAHNEERRPPQETGTPPDADHGTQSLSRSAPSTCTEMRLRSEPLACFRICEMRDTVTPYTSAISFRLISFP